MGKAKSVLLATAALLSMLVGMVVSTPSATAAPSNVLGNCGSPPFDVYISGAEAHWTLSCFNGRIYMDGRVDDTRGDGHCAEVKGVFSDHTSYARNCPATSPPTYFSWSGPGDTVYGYLYLV
jgi:hypothetical protein